MMKIILKDSRRYVLRFDKQEIFTEELIKFCQINNIESGVFWGIGAISKALLSFYNAPEKKYLDKEFNQEQEVASLNGVVAELNGKTMIHAHGTFSDIEMKLVGGHIKELTISSTLEDRKSVV